MVGSIAKVRSFPAARTHISTPSPSRLARRGRKRIHRLNDSHLLNPVCVQHADQTNCQDGPFLRYVRVNRSGPRDPHPPRPAPSNILSRRPTVDLRAIEDTL